MIRVVPDSNIYISALLFGGKPRAILELAERGLVEICLSEPIWSEVDRVLTRKFNWPEDRLRQAGSYLRSVAVLTIPQEIVTDCSDPDDNKILECALESRAKAIVTGDRHLLIMHPYRGITILTASLFFESKLWETE